VLRKHLASTIPLDAGKAMPRSGNSTLKVRQKIATPVVTGLRNHRLLTANQRGMGIALSNLNTCPFLQVDLSTTNLSMHT